MPTIQQKIQSIIDKANATTGKTDADMTTATQSLVDGFGGGAKPEQEKTVTITQNGTTEVTPDEGKALSKVTAVVEVPENQILDYVTSANGLFRNASGQIPKIDINFKNTKFNGDIGSLCVYANVRGISMDTVTLSSSFLIDSVSFSESFRQCSGARIIDITGLQYKTIRHIARFIFASPVEEIRGALDLTGCVGTDAAFNNNTALREIEFRVNTIKVSIRFDSPLLSPASVQSIIDGLADLSAGTAQTLTLNAAIQLSEAQRASITAKNWNLVQ